jgi:hypothetical protein
LVLVGFSLWLLPSMGRQPRESSSASPSAPETTESVLDTSSSGAAGSDSSAPAPGPVPPETLQQPTDTAPMVPGVVRFEKSLPPGARVTIDSIETQLTPEGHLSVQPGSHRVRVLAPGFRPGTRTVVVAAGDTATLPLELVRIDSTARTEAPAGGVGPGQIVVNGKLPSGAEISVDGWPLPPGARLAQVDSGSHWVAISAPGFEPDSSSIHLGPGGRAIWRVPRLTAVPLSEKDTSGSAEPASEPPVPPAPALDSSPPGAELGE